jgi:D-alanine transaminase
MHIPLANWNGEELPLDKVRVSVMDRSFLFGDGVYEVIRVYHRRAFLLEEHLARLQRSLGELRIRTDLERLRRRLLETLDHSRVVDGLIYIHVSRGEAPRRSHIFPVPPPVPNELIYVRELERHPHAALRADGAKAITVDDIRWKRCDIKSVNLLGNILAAQTAEDAGCDEAILVAEDGGITEGSHTSVFGVKDGCILTAPLAANVLPGITRRLVVELAREADICVREESLTRDSLWSLDELFLTGTTSEVLPVTTVDGKAIGAGAPGPIAGQLYRAYQKRIDQLASDGDS